QLLSVLLLDEHTEAVRDLQPSLVVHARRMVAAQHVRLPVLLPARGRWRVHPARESVVLARFAALTPHRGTREATFLHKIPLPSLEGPLGAVKGEKSQPLGFFLWMTGRPGLGIGGRERPLHVEGGVVEDLLRF